jgi:hypothetical protein
MRWALAAALLSACSFKTNERSADAPSPDAVAQAWWDPAWPYRLRLTIFTQTALPLGFQLGFSPSLDAPPCTGNRDGVRVVSGATDLPRVIDELGATQWVWFKLTKPIAASSTSIDYYLYCGNQSPTPAMSDPAAVFDFYDAFPGSSLGSAWMSQGSVAVSGGFVQLHAPDAAISTNATLPPGNGVDFAMSADANAVSEPYFWGGFDNQFSFNDPWVRWFGGFSSGQLRGSTDLPTQSASYGTNQTFDTTKHLYGVESYDASAAFRIDDLQVDSLTYGGTLATPMNVTFYNHASGPSGNGILQIEMVRTRKVATPVPSVMLGMPELYRP